MTQYLYPQNLKAAANLWLWGLRDFVILGVAALLSIVLLVRLRMAVPLALTLLGLRGFTRYGLSTTQGELLFFQVAPTNISVLSQANIAIKIRHLMMVLSALPDLEITCTDASERFDGNKAYLAGRLAVETNQKVRRLIQKDIAALDELQSEMSTARQFLFTARCRNLKPEQVFQKANAVEKRISEQGFEVHRMKKPEIKRFLALYFESFQPL